MAIPSETIEQVAAANDIVEVIGTYFPLKRAGASFKALCPFHQEKTPSFTVSPQRQTFHCFGCGAGGSVFRFVMDYEHLEFLVAVHKLAGRVVASVAATAKYIDSPGTALLVKGCGLFGLHKTKRALILTDLAVVCEGQLCLITLFEAGIQNVVAPQRTAFTDNQAHVLKRFIREVLLCFDSDTAGQNAAERSLEALLQNDLVVRVAEMPAQEDPDSLVRKSGRQKFEELVAVAPDFFDYWIEKKAATTDLNSLGAKMQVARELAASVTFLRDPVMRGEVMNKISARLAMRVVDFETLVKPGQPFRQGDAKVATPIAAPSHDVAMLCLLALRDEEARAFLLEQNWREVLANVPGSDLLTKILQADLRPADSASLNLFQTTLSPAEESLVSGWLLQKMPANPATLAREWWNGLRQAILRRELEAAESRLRLPNLTNGEIMQLQKQVLDLRGQLHDVPRFSPARAQQL